MAELLINFLAHVPWLLKSSWNYQSVTHRGWTCKTVSNLRFPDGWKRLFCGLFFGNNRITLLNFEKNYRMSIKVKYLLSNTDDHDNDNNNDNDLIYRTEAGPNFFQSWCRLLTQASSLTETNLCSNFCLLKQASIHLNLIGGGDRIWKSK